MKRASMFAPVLALLVFGGPIMACLVPTAQLSAEEKQCCKEMAGDCGTSSTMPESHSCCDTVIRPHNDQLPSASLSLSVPLSQWTAPAPFLAVPPIENTDRFGLLLARAHAPPGSALEASSPLRI